MKFIYKFSVWTSSIFVLQYVFFILWLYSTKSAIFGTNDDELISSIVNGHFTGSPDVHLIFIQPLIGIILKNLQLLIPQINVYSHFLLIIVILSYSIVIALTLMMKNNILKFISITFLLLFNITFVTWFSINPTYTGASLFSVGAASYLFILALQINNKKDFIFINCIANLMLVIGFLIRKESIFIFIIICIPTIIYFLIKHRYQIKFRLKVLIISTLFIFGINLLNQMLFSYVYSGKEWNEYILMNNARHQIQLRAPEKEMEKYLNQIKWDNETYNLFKRFSLLDKNLMNSTTMNEIIDLTSDYVGPKSIFKSDILDSINKVIYEFNPWTWILKLMLFYLLTIIALLVFSRNFKIIINVIILNLSFIIIIFLSTVILASGYQLPERITLNILAASAPVLIVLNLINVSNDLKFDGKKIKIFLFIFIVIFLINNYLYRFKNETEVRLNFYKTRIAYSLSQQKALANINKNNIIMYRAAAIKADWRFPYSTHFPFGNSEKTISLGWLNLSPIWLHYLDRMGIDGNNFPKEYFNKSVYFVEDPEKIEDLVNYLLNQKFNFDVKDHGNFENSDYRIYQFVIK